MMIYLCSPYSDPDPAVRQQRFEQVCRIAADLMKSGMPVFCPIAHSHPIATIGGLLANDTDYWARFNWQWMAACTEVQIAKMPGWEQSKGVQREIGFARTLGLPVSFIEVPE